MDTKSLAIGLSGGLACLRFPILLDRAMINWLVITP